MQNLYYNTITCSTLKITRAGSCQFVPTVCPILDSSQQLQSFLPDSKCCLNGEGERFNKELREHLRENQNADCDFFLSVSETAFQNNPRQKEIVTSLGIIKITHIHLTIRYMYPVGQKPLLFRTSQMIIGRNGHTLNIV